MPSQAPSGFAARNTHPNSKLNRPPPTPPIMDIDNDPRIERIGEPAAPTFNLQQCQRWIASAQNFRRQPLGGFIADELLPQLKCACDELASVGTRIADANNQMLRYQKEAETANAEVRTMQRLLGDEREKTAVLEQRVKTLGAELEAAKTPPVEPPKPPSEVAQAPKRGRRAKVVPIESPKSAAQ